MTVAFTLRLEEDLDEKLEYLAFLQRTSKTALIREAVENLLKQYPEAKDPRK